MESGKVIVIAGVKLPVLFVETPRPFVACVAGRDVCVLCPGREVEDLASLRRLADQRGDFGKRPG